MQRYTQLTILLPCHSLEDFPLHHEGDDAQGLLANWTAMFHPALVHSAGKMPSWARVDDPPEELAGRLLLIPSVAAGDIPAGFAARAGNEGAVVIKRGLDRAEIVAEATSRLEPSPPNIDPEVVADFLALGYCYLQVELLTRQMRYASNLDEVYFEGQLTAAAAAAVSGDETKTRELLQSLFDVLGEERDHFYPVDAYLMDLTLVADTTMGQSLRDELQCQQFINLLLSGEVAVRMATDQPETAAALRAALEEGRATLVGGEYTEGPMTLLDHEAFLAELDRGQIAYEKHLAARPHVYGRRRFGLASFMPGVLSRHGFRGAMHATFDGGTFPHGSQTKTIWEGDDNGEIPALARPPLDAHKPESFLNLCIKMGESMDSDHVATLYFAHWPGQVSPWYEDLRRIARWGPALGKWVTMATYFEETGDSGLRDRFDADRYRPPYLKQAVIREEANAISSFVNYYRGRTEEQAATALETLAALLTGKLDETYNSVLRTPYPGLRTPHSALEDSAVELAAALPRARAAAKRGYLIANPHSFVRRLCVEVPELTSLPNVEKPIYAAGESDGRKHVVVDVPPMGFAWVTAGDGEASKSQKPLVEEGVLRNEYFEILIDETTGGLKSLHDYKTRGNRLSQRLALRMPAKRAAGDAWDTAAEMGYSVMAVDSIEVTAADAALGEITARGRLVDREGAELAGFVQRYRATRGSRVLQIDIELEPREQPRADPWNSYVACRWAWADEAGDLYRCAAGVRTPTGNKRIESPHYIDIDVPKQITTILAGGLPYHRRIGLRMLDTLLVVRGESATKFTVGVGIDLKYPYQEALSLITPPTANYETAAPPAGATSGWLFHIDSKNVVATHWEPLVEDGKVAGFRVRLLECYGRPAKMTLTSFRNVSSARTIDLQGEPLGDCDVAGDKITCELGPREWRQLEARW